jgi:hypothetical protein
MAKKKRKTDFSFARFFNPSKSPNGSSFLNGEFYIPIHRKRMGILIWNSKKFGAFRGSVRDDLILQSTQRTTKK